MISNINLSMRPHCYNRLLSLGVVKLKCNQDYVNYDIWLFAKRIQRNMVRQGQQVAIRQP